MFNWFKKKDPETIRVERNLKGKQLEKQGKVDRAISLYESNVKEGFIGSHPYERLRIIYTKRKDYANAIRACKSYLTATDNELRREIDAKKRARFQDHIIKLEKKGD